VPLDEAHRTGESVTRPYIYGAAAFLYNWMNKSARLFEETEAGTIYFMEAASGICV
jgi:hypothetical protein